MPDNERNMLVVEVVPGQTRCFRAGNPYDAVATAQEAMQIDRETIMSNSKWYVLSDNWEKMKTRPGV